MGKTTSNVGQLGPESVRFKGMKIDDLPIAEAAHAKAGMVAYLKTDHDNKIAGVRARYPDTPIPSIDGFLKECKANLKRTRDFIADVESKKNEYSALIGLCKHRDKEIAKLDPETDAAEIKALRLQFPPYNVQAMLRQIKQFEESINMGHEVCGKEMDSINELNKLRAVCEQRDQELKALGVAV
jgi:hypothetical protein